MKGDFHPKPVNITDRLTHTGHLVDIVGTYESLVKDLTSEEIILGMTSEFPLREIFPHIWAASEGLLAEEERQAIVEESGIDRHIPQEEIENFIALRRSDSINELTPDDVKHIIRVGKMRQVLHDEYKVSIFTPQLTAPVPEVDSFDLVHLRNLVGKKDIPDALFWLNKISIMVKGRARADVWGNDDGQRIPWRKGMRAIYGEDLFDEAYFDDNQLTSTLKVRLTIALYELSRMCKPFYLRNVLDKTQSDLARVYKQPLFDQDGQLRSRTDTEKLSMARLWEITGDHMLLIMAGETPVSHPYLT